MNKLEILDYYKHFMTNEELKQFNLKVDYGLIELVTNVFLEALEEKKKSGSLVSQIVEYNEIVDEPTGHLTKHQIQINVAVLTTEKSWLLNDVLREITHIYFQNKKNPNRENSILLSQVVGDKIIELSQII